MSLSPAEIAAARLGAVFALLDELPEGAEDGELPDDLRLRIQEVGGLSDDEVEHAISDEAGGEEQPEESAPEEAAEPERNAMSESPPEEEAAPAEDDAPTFPALSEEQVAEAKLAAVLAVAFGASEEGEDDDHLPEDAQQMIERILAMSPELVAALASEEVEEEAPAEEVVPLQQQRATQYARLAQGALRYGDRYSASIYQRQADALATVATPRHWFERADDVLRYEWVSSQTKTGKTKWTDPMRPGDVRYQEKKPGERKKKAEAPAEKPAAAPKPTAKERKATAETERQGKVAESAALIGKLKRGEVGTRDLFQITRALTHMKLAELRALRQSLGVESDFLGGRSKADVSRKLLAHLSGVTPELADVPTASLREKAKALGVKGATTMKRDLLEWEIKKGRKDAERAKTAPPPKPPVEKKKPAPRAGKKPAGKIATAGESVTGTEGAAPETPNEDVGATSAGVPGAGPPAGRGLGEATGEVSGEQLPAPDEGAPGGEQPGGLPVRPGEPGEGHGELPGGAAHEPGDRAGSGAGEDVSAAGGEGGGGDAGRPGAVGDGGGVGGHGGGGGEGTGPQSAGEAVAAASAVKSAPPTPEQPTDVSAGNFRYTNSDFVPKGIKAKYKANLEAVRLLKELQAEGRTSLTPAEQETLSRYVGWGQFPALFNDRDYEWEKERDALRGLVTAEEWEAAKKSTLNAHYTHPDVVRAHWELAQRLGFDGGRYLETSAGIGYYLGMMPGELASQTRSSAVELDPLTGNMLKLLYPASNVTVGGFESTQPPANFYDLVASNVPFGDYTVHDPVHNKGRHLIHDYFFLKSAALTRPGGLVMHVTSDGTLDKMDAKVRQELAKTCDFVGAIRFPGGMHQSNAGTAVVTDLVVLRKRHPNELPVDPNVTPPEAEPDQPGFTGITVDSLGRLYHWVDGKRVPGPDWLATVDTPDPAGGEPIKVNKYFADHPEMVLGTIDRTGTMRTGNMMNVSAVTPEQLSEAMGRRVVLRKGSEWENQEETARRGKYVFEDGSRVPPEEVARVAHELTQQRLKAAMERLPQGVMKRSTVPPDRTSPEAMPAPGAVKEGGFLVKDGKLYSREKGQLVEQEAKPKDLARIQGMLEVRDAWRAYVNDQLAGRDADASRARLNEVYDAFVKKHGLLNDRANKTLFRDDPDSSALLALEDKYDPKAKTAKKAAAFFKNTTRSWVPVTSAATHSDALGVSLQEHGRVNVKRMAELMGQPEQNVAAALVEQGLAYEDPSAGWLPADLYLSGNVRRKLLDARAAAAADPKFNANVAALEKVQPEDIDYARIGVKLGAGWIPPSDVAQFASELLNGRPEHFEIGYNPTTGEWQAGYANTASTRWLINSQTAREVWGTDRAHFDDLLQAALNGKTVTIWDKTVDGERYVNVKATQDANAKVQEIKDAFKNWVWDDDDRRERLHRFYNDNFNNIRPLRYNGSHQTFPGMNPGVNLRDHQKDFVWQVVTTGTGLAAHEVGTGKTYSLIASAMELRRLGLAKKPAIVCLKANVEAITRDAQKLYPGARIISTVDMFDAKSRKQTAARIATGDYDMVIMTHDHFELLPTTPETTAEYIRGEIKELTEVILARQDAGTKADNRIVKDMQKQLANLEARLKDVTDEGRKDDAVYFEELGIDQVFVDEAHEFKNLKIHTTHQGIKGIPTGKGSNQATDMHMKARWLQSQNAGRGVVFATGTPVTNTMAELYNMQRYLQPEQLRERGIEAFDAWARQFGDVVTRSEFTVAGEYKPVSRFAEFTNLAALRQIAGQMMDVQRADDMVKQDGEKEINRPKRQDEMVVSPKSEAMDQLMKSLVDRAKAIKGPAQKGGDNMLVICTDGRKGSVDMRLLYPDAPDDPQSKSNRCVDRTLELFRRDPTRTQLIFSDLGVHPNDHGFHLYGDIINKLVAGGIPREKIADFSQLEGAKKEAAQEAMRKGEILVGIGGTAKLGTGVNVQDRLAALHHLDVPWRPSDVEQRDGRGWRQGNENKELGVYRYISEGSLDATFWQVIARKAGFIKQGVAPATSAGPDTIRDDDETLSPEELMAAATGDQRVIEKVNLDEEIKQLDSAADRHFRSQRKLSDTIRNTERTIPEMEANQKRTAADAQVLEANPDFSLEVGGQVYTDRKEASAALEAAITAAGRPYGRATVAIYRGLPIQKHYDGSLWLQGQNGHAVNATLASVESIARFLPRRVEDMAAAVEKTRQDVARLKADLGKPFAKKDELEQKRLRLKELEVALANKDKEQQPGAGPVQLARRRPLPPAPSPARLVTVYARLTDAAMLNDDYHSAELYAEAARRAQRAAHFHRLAQQALRHCDPYSARLYARAAREAMYS